MKMHMRWKLLLGLAVSGLFLYYTFYDIDFHDLYDKIRHARYIYLIPAQLMLWFGLLCRAQRFKVITDQKTTISLRDSFSAMMVGYFGNGVLPARLGEFMRARVVQKHAHNSYSTSLGFVALERILDLFYMLLLFLLFLVLSLGSGAAINAIPRKYLILGGLLAFVPFTMLFIILLKESLFKRVVYKLLFFLSEPRRVQIIAVLERFLEASHAIKKPVFFLRMLYWSLLVWLPVVLNVYFVILCFPELGTVPMQGAMLVVILTAVGISVPQGPGFVGPYHAAVKLSLSAYSNQESSIGALALVLHLVQFIPIILVGWLFFYAEHLRIPKAPPETAQANPVADGS